MLFDPSAGKVVLKGPREIAAMRRAGRLASQCLAHLLAHVRPGVSTQELDDLLTAFARRHRARPATLGYKGFPRSICTAVNEVICHGIPSKRHILREGDIVGIDVTLIVDGYYGDTAATVPVGEVTEEARRLLAAALETLKRGIGAVRPGGHLGDIGHAIQAYAEPLGYSVVRDFVGHGLGRVFHESPLVPHYGRRGEGLRLRPGMTFTVEPMINEGTHRALVLNDGWTAVTADGKLSAQFEHTLAVTEDGVEILTVQNDERRWENPGRFDPA